ncbi:MAG: UDP-2,3-diacylglucosamine diphosphatase LpxI [Holosporales bacterium]|nr:UDP-2,3-diacylglucosamine diphosphatase LpxI [Holosporales bacterium]
MRRIAVICGNGDLAKECIDSCSARGELSCVVAIKGDCLMENFPCPFICTHLGYMGTALDFIKMHNSTHVMLIGGIKRPSVSELKLDSIGRRWLIKLGTLVFAGDNELLKGIASLLEKENLQVIAASEVLGNAGPSIKTKLAPDSLAISDIKKGVTVAEALGSLDIGQSIVVQQGIVLGVEAKEGTDALLDRCAGLRLAGPGGVLVKLVKPNQDQRLDMPAIGTETVKRAASAGLRGIAIESSTTLIADKKEMLNTADELGLFIVEAKGYC